MMKPGTMTAVGDMVMAAFPLNHELMWTHGKPCPDNEAFPHCRAYCRCGWVAPPYLDQSLSRVQFVNHLLELQNDQD